jgi:hypothetical protein
MKYIPKIKHESPQTGDDNTSTYELWDDYSLFSMSCKIEKKNNYYNIIDIFISFHNGDVTEKIYTHDNYESITTLNQILFDIKSIFISKINEFLNLDSNKDRHKAKMIYKYQDRVNEIYNKSLELEELKSELLESLSNETFVFCDSNGENVINTNYYQNNLIFNVDTINEIMN